MKPKPIGIIGGAGPLAGALLLERILFLAGKMYGCYKDVDFPKIFLISYPFSEMLSSNIDIGLVRQEVDTCLHQLRSNGAIILAIACNTLHAFLNEDETQDLVHLPRILAKELPTSCEPLVLCTSTSVRFGLHKQFFSCLYPDPQTQARVDELIDKTLKGLDQQILLQMLEELIQEQTADTIILGCTELSLFTQRLKVSNKSIIDPLELAAYKILERSFCKKTL